jgi:hypothetical protein
VVRGNEGLGRRGGTCMGFGGGMRGGGGGIKAARRSVLQVYIDTGVRAGPVQLGMYTANQAYRETVAAPCSCCCLLPPCSLLIVPFFPHPLGAPASGAAAWPAAAAAGGWAACVWPRPLRRPCGVSGGRGGGAASSRRPGAAGAAGALCGGRFQARGAHAAGGW